MYITEPFWAAMSLSHFVGTWVFEVCVCVYPVMLTGGTVISVEFRGLAQSG